MIPWWAAAIIAWVAYFLGFITHALLTMNDDKPRS